jgi:hypothetical protein
MKLLWLQLRLWLGWDNEARQARAHIDLIQWIGKIRLKAEAYDQRMRAATIESGVGREHGDMVVLHLKHLPTGEQPPKHTQNQKVLNIIPSVPKRAPLLISEHGLDMVELGDNAAELLAAWKLGEPTDTIRSRIMDRTDTAIDIELPELDWAVEVPD